MGRRVRVMFGTRVRLVAAVAAVVTLCALCASSQTVVVDSSFDVSDLSQNQFVTISRALESLSESVRVEVEVGSGDGYVWPSAPVAYNAAAAVTIVGSGSDETTVYVAAPLTGGTTELMDSTFVSALKVNVLAGALLGEKSITQQVNIERCVLRGFQASQWGGLVVTAGLVTLDTVVVEGGGAPVGGLVAGMGSGVVLRFIKVEVSNVVAQSGLLFFVLGDGGDVDLNDVVVGGSAAFGLIGTVLGADVGVVAKDVVVSEESVLLSGGAGSLYVEGSVPSGAIACTGAGPVSVADDGVYCTAGEGGVVGDDDAEGTCGPAYGSVVMSMDPCEWRCAAGYMESAAGDACEACEALPLYAVRTGGSQSCDWECLAGFVHLNGACMREAACVVPDGGFLTGGADCAFECAGGLVKSGVECVAAAVTQCGFGYRLTGGACVACQVTAGAFLTGGANCAYECAGDLVKSGAVCVTVEVTECDFGYQLMGGACVACDVTDNGFLSGGAECEFQCVAGYVKTGEVCVAAAMCPVTSGAFLTGGANCAYECAGGLVKSGVECVAVTVTQCDFGYRLTGGACVACPVTAGAFLTGGANCAYECAGDLVKSGAVCVTVDVTECDFGYQLMGGACVACDVTDNGFLSGGAECEFQCVAGYVKTGEVCVAAAVCPVTSGAFLTGGANCAYECAGGLVKSGVECVAAPVTQCGFGYRLTDGACVACPVTAGAFLTGGANCAYECVGDLVKSGAGCVTAVVCAYPTYSLPTHVGCGFVCRAGFMSAMGNTECVPCTETPTGAVYDIGSTVTCAWECPGGTYHDTGSSTCLTCAVECDAGFGLSAGMVCSMMTPPCPACTAVDATYTTGCSYTCPSGWEDIGNGGGCEECTAVDATYTTGCSYTCPSGWEDIGNGGGCEECTAVDATYTTGCSYTCPASGWRDLGNGGGCEECTAVDATYTTGCSYTCPASGWRDLGNGGGCEECDAIVNAAFTTGCLYECTTGYYEVSPRTCSMCAAACLSSEEEVVACGMGADRVCCALVSDTSLYMNGNDCTVLCVSGGAIATGGGGVGTCPNIPVDRCQDVFSASSSAMDGVYYLDYGESTAYGVYCHFYESYGWELALKIAPGSMDFEYSSVWWTDSLLHGSTTLDLSNEDAVFQPYLSGTVGETMIWFDRGLVNEWRMKMFGVAGSTLSVLTDGSEMTTEDLATAFSYFVELPESLSIQHTVLIAGYNFVRANVSARIAVSGNQEGSLASNDSATGVGIVDVGNIATIPSGAYCSSTGCGPPSCTFPGDCVSPTHMTQQTGLVFVRAP